MGSRFSTAAGSNILVASARRLGLSTSEQPRDLAYALAFFIGYWVFDVASRAVADLQQADVSGPSLLVDAAGGNAVAFVAVAVLVGVVASRSPRRWACRWVELDRGVELRWLILPILVLLTWQGSLYRYNYLLHEGHVIDRALLVALAVGVVVRPAFLLPFVIQSRIIAAQFALPFGTLAAQNIDELLVIVLVAVAAAHAVHTVTTRVDSAPVMLVVAAALATHFFIPGRGKVLLNWIVNEDLTNLPMNGYTVGWLGHTGGDFAVRLADLADALNGPMRVATIVFELSAALVVAHHRLFRWWLPGAIVFHIVNFAFLGFWFLGWIALEVTLIVLLNRPSLREWFDRNLTMGRAALTAGVVVVLGPVLFHPPGLAWLDTPVSYGYEFEVDGVSGRTYRLPIDRFAPFTQEVTFSRLQFGRTRRLTGAYGVVATTAELEPLDRLRALSEVTALEVPVSEADADAMARSERFLAAFVEVANERATGSAGLADLLGPIGPLPKYWTSSPGPAYSFQEPVTTIRVFRITNLRTADGFERLRTPVHTMVAG